MIRHFLLKILLTSRPQAGTLAPHLICRKYFRGRSITRGLFHPLSNKVAYAVRILAIHLDGIKHRLWSVKPVALYLGEPFQRPVKDAAQIVGSGQVGKHVRVSCIFGEMICKGYNFDPIRVKHGAVIDARQVVCVHKDGKLRNKAKLSSVDGSGRDELVAGTPLN